MECQLCIYAQAHGWWGKVGIFHCRDCHRTWTATREAHCVDCHRHFSSPGGFDAHLVGPPSKPAEHRDPFNKTRPFAKREDGTWFQPDRRFVGELGREGVLL